MPPNTDFTGQFDIGSLTTPGPYKHQKTFLQPKWTIEKENYMDVPSAADNLQPLSPPHKLTLPGGLPRAQRRGGAGGPGGTLLEAALDLSVP